MTGYNDGKAEKCGLAAYWAAGQDGSGMTVAVLDEEPYIRPHMDKEIFSAPLGEGSSASHATNVAQVVHEAAPGAKVVMLPFMGGDDRLRTMSWLAEHPVDLINMSLNLTTGAEFYPALQALGVPIIAAAGNNGPDTADVARPARFEWTIAVGGIYESGALYQANSNGDNMDCVTYTNIDIAASPGYVVPFGGTSAAAPWLCGMLACYYTGRKRPGVEDIRRLIRANCRDLDDPGKDRASGYGEFILPPIAAAGEVDTMDKVDIKLELGRALAVVNGEDRQLDCAPFARDGRTFVPLRFVAEALGCQVDYANGQIHVYKG